MVMPDLLIKVWLIPWMGDPWIYNEVVNSVVILFSAAIVVLEMKFGAQKGTELPSVEELSVNILGKRVKKDRSLGDPE